MKKYSWIAALLAALTISVFFISCGENFDATQLAPKPWTIEAKDIKLEKVGDDGISVDGNKFINKASTATWAGFAWKLDKLAKNEDGFAWSDFEKVRVTIKIVELKQPAAGVSYNAKSDRGMGTDVNRFGEIGNYKNGVLVIGGAGDEAYSDYPVADFLKSQEIAFQYNAWEGNSAIVAGGGITNPNHTIEVSFTFFTKIDEPVFVPVDDIAGVPSVIYNPIIVLTGYKAVGAVDATTGKTKNPNNTDITWTLLNNSDTTKDITKNNNTADATWIAKDYSFNPAVDVYGTQAILIGSSQIKARNTVKDIAIPAPTASDGTATELTYGQFTIKATVVNGNGMGANFEKEFKITYKEPPFPVFAAPTISLGTGAAKSSNVNGGQWQFGGQDSAWTGYNGSVPNILNAKYFVLAVAILSDNNPDGFGGLQFAVQGKTTDDPTLDWAGASDIKNIGNWTALKHEIGDINYFVFDLSEFTQFVALRTKFASAPGTIEQVQFYVNYGAAADLPLVTGYLTSEDLSALPTGDGVVAVNFPASSNIPKSYVTNTIPPLTLAP